MIDIRDLRIGNWVYDGERTQFPMQVVGIGTDYVYLDFEGNEGDLWENKPEDLIGISMRGDVLKKIGFKYYSDNRYELCEDDVLITAHPITRIFRIEKLDPFANIEATFTSEKIRSLHELQNAFYITTKRQLKIEL